ncbi:MAG: DUF2282 domain-containing protein [Gammaproteobacteria bacterium]
MKKSKLAYAVAIAFISSQSLTALAHNPAPPPGMEKCYGIVKGKQNECGTKQHVCATLSKQDRDPQAWIFLPKGKCDKIAGASTTPSQDNA